MSIPAKSLRRKAVYVLAALAIPTLLYAGFVMGYNLAMSEIPEIKLQQAQADESLVDGINRLRAEVSKPALTEDTVLNKTAQIRADEIAACGQNCYNHTRPDGSEGTTPIYAHSSYRDAGENLVECAGSNKEAVESWRNSPDHYANILGTLHTREWTRVGIGRALDTSNGCLVHVAHFAS